MGDRILVIGSDGFVGHRLISSLLSQGERPIAVSRRPFRNDLTGAEQIVGELTESSQIIQLLEHSRTVVYLASRSTPGTSSGRPVEEVRNNLLPLMNLLHALQQTPNVNLLYLSSGGSLYLGGTGVPITEISAVQPRSYHGAAKIAAEYFINAWSRQYKGRATLLRPSNIYGPGQTERTGFGIIPTCFGKIVRGERLPVWGNGSAVRDYLYIDDFIDLCIKVIRSPMPVGAQIFNASSGTGVSLNDLFLAIETVTQKQLPRSYEPQRTVDAGCIVMDASQAERRYGWTSKVPLLEGLEKTWDWFITTQQ